MKTFSPAWFIEPMECLSVSKLPDGSQWVYEITLDTARALSASTQVTGNPTYRYLTVIRLVTNRELSSSLEAQSETWR